MLISLRCCGFPWDIYSHGRPILYTFKWDIIDHTIVNTFQDISINMRYGQFCLYLVVQSWVKKSNYVIFRPRQKNVKYKVLIDNDLDMHIQAKTNNRRVRRFGDILAPLSRETKLNMRFNTRVTKSPESLICIS